MTPATPPVTPTTPPATPFDPPLEWLRSRHGLKWHHPGPDIIPAWVADMDFAVCPAVRDAVGAVLERGDLGYPDWPVNPLAEPFSERMAQRYGWHPAPDHVRGVNDLVQAFQVFIQLCTEPGDAVALHVPTYPPFLSSVGAAGRRAAMSQMIGDGPTWSFDADRLDHDIRTSNAKVLVLVNPHNPTGRVFARADLERLAEIACRHDMVAISDEIHAELTHDNHQHLPFASLSHEVEARTVTLTSASKSFNIAGLRTAVAHIGAQQVRDAWDSLSPEPAGTPNVLGVEATLAAWGNGDRWLAELRRHLGAQRDHLAERIHELPGTSFRPPEATYLAWLDCRAARLPGDPAQIFRERGHIELNSGPTFGPGGEDHARLNFATSRRILDEIVDRMLASLR